MDLSGIKIINNFLTKIEKTIEKSKVNLDEYEVFYRGESSYYEKTIPGIFHNNNNLENEHKLFRELELRYPNVFDNAKSTIDKLAIMQHYGLPTRLLDFTTNPLLALYMAIDKEDVSQICPTIKMVFVKKEAIKYYDSDTVSVLANFSKMDFRKDIKIEKKQLLWIVEKIFDYYEKDKFLLSHREISDNALKEFKLDGYEIKELLKTLKSKYEGPNEINIKDLASISKKLKHDYPKYALAEGFCYAINNIHYLLHLIKDEKPYFKDMIWVEHFDKSVVFVKPKHNSQRLINQAGLFALFGIDNGEKKSFSLEEFEEKSQDFIIDTFLLCECIDDKEDLCTKDYIKQLKTALGVLGITRDKVYPEMENASKYIKELFEKKS